MPIRGHLHAAVKAAGEIIHEMLGIFGITTTDEPIADQLAIGANRGPRPHIAGKGWRILGRSRVLFLRINEGPNLIALDALAAQPLHVLIVIVEAGFACFRPKLRHRVDGNANHARD